MKRLMLFFGIIGCIMLSGRAFAQITYNPTIQSKNNSCVIEKIELVGEEMIVTLNIPTENYNKFSISKTTVCMPAMDFWHNHFRRENWNDSGYSLKNNVRIYPGLLRTITGKREGLYDIDMKIKSIEDLELGAYYQIINKKIDFVTCRLHFPRPIRGTEQISIRELDKDGWEWIGIKINNPYPEVERVAQNELEIKEMINTLNDPICGIYEYTGENKLTLACVKHNGDYKLLFVNKILRPDYVKMIGDNQGWEIGEVRVKLTPTAIEGLFKASYGCEEKLYWDRYVSFNNVMMKIFHDEESADFIKLYPSNTLGIPISKTSGSGLVLGKNYIVTNYHVVNGAKSIIIRGVKGNFDVQYTADIVVSDRNNDLAILKVNDPQFVGFTNVLYAAKIDMSDVGENIFVLGYPLTSTMGEEVKLTTGVISSRGGFQGDITSYQISAPIHAGNSGGPLFDSKGNLIGIVRAKHTQAENVGYAIKTSYLKILVENAGENITWPINNQISKLPLVDKIKIVKNYVVLIECSK